MDARQGVNYTEEQHIMICCSNKVDDPDNPEQTALLGEARAAVEQMFHVTDRQTALSDILLLHHSSQENSNNDDGQPPDGSLFPAVMPISAMHAFVYRCVAHHGCPLTSFVK
eukprot:scaffold66093_cov48-Attheya_sp.AAC.1